MEGNLWSQDCAEAIRDTLPLPHKVLTVQAGLPRARDFPMPLQVMSPQPTQAGAGEACNLPAAGVCCFQPFLPNETYHALGPLPSPSWEKQNRQTTELGESLAASPAPTCGTRSAPYQSDPYSNPTPPSYSRVLSG